MSRRSLPREIGAALAFKALALAVIYFLFFERSHKTVVTPAIMAAYLVDQPAVPRQQGHKGE